MDDDAQASPPRDLLEVIGDLSAVAALFAEVTDLDGLARPLEAVLERLLAVEYDALYLWDFRASRLRLIYSRGFTEEERREAERTAIDRHPGRVFRDKTVLHLGDTEKEPGASQTSAQRRFKVRSRLFMPVTYGEQSLGTFGLASPRPNAFTAEHVAILDFVCRLIAVFYRQFLDRDERRETARQLESTARRLQLVINSLPIALVIVDSAGTIELAEGAALGLLRGDEGEGHPGDLVGAAVEVGLGGIDLRALLGGALAAEHVLPIGARALGLRGFARDDGGATLVLEDITERQRNVERLRDLNVELRRARDAAIDATRAKSRFLANMSHELRTPLNAIIGYGEMLAEDADEGHIDPETLGDDLEQIIGAAKHLLALINDILDLSKVEAGKFRLQVTEVDLAGLVADMRATMLPLCRRSGNRFNVRAPSSLPAVATDEIALRRILINLLSNANKFTSGGEVTLELDDARAAEGRLRFAVHDTGIGISGDDQARIFAPFIQVDTSPTRRFGGTGLGLTITRELVELLGGEITVTSAPQEGSTFTFSIPPLTGELKGPKGPKGP